MHENIQEDILWGKTDFSGFDRSSWVPRTSEEHKRYAKMTEKATKKAAQKRLEAQYGARWSEILISSIMMP